MALLLIGGVLSLYLYSVAKGELLVERTDLVVKSIVAFVTGVVSMMVGLVGLFMTILIGLMVIDFITGVFAAMYKEGLRSSKGIKGLIKKIYIILLLGAVFLIEMAVLKSNGVITDGISAAFCVMEFVSIVENGDKMGVKIPQRLKKFIATMKNKVEETDENINEK